MTRKLLTHCIFAFGVMLAYQPILFAQQEAAPEGGSNFSLSPNDLGALQNSVNLYTGQVSFPMTVALLPGRGGLSPKITINYNSAGVKNTVESWNRESPTGILGLGWSFNYPRIVANHNNTATRNDDTFYLVEGGQSVRLICLEHSESGVSEYRPYATEIYQPWRIRYYPGTEKWEIVKDDGVKYIYGDRSREADGTLQNVIAYGNWIGDSKQRTGQTEVTHTWNLSEIRNLWEDKITYYYQNIEEPLGDPNTGSSSATYTRASALHKIVGPTGNYIQLNYGTKIYARCTTDEGYRCTDRNREYQDPHEEADEPDAYQEQYEHRYLNTIQAFDHRGLPSYDVAFEYGSIGVGEYYKRILTGIEQTNYTGAKLPKTSFEYDTAATDTKGYLTLVNNSIGGRISYQYANTSTVIGRVCPSPGMCGEFRTSFLAEREFKAESPGQDWTEPNLFMGPGYVVVIWRQDVEIPFLGRTFHTTDPRPTHLQVYEWQGEWIKHDLGYIGELRLSGDIEKQELVVAIEQDHFGVVLRQGNNTYRVNLFHKNKFNGSWHSYTDNVTLTDGKLNNATYLGELFFSAGHDYVALGNIGTERMYAYAWMNGRWDKKIFQHSPAPGYAFTGSSHYLIAHNTKPRDDDFWLHYRAEDKRWITRDFAPIFLSDGIDTNELKDKSFWYSTPTFAFVMANKNPEFVYNLGGGYLNHTRKSLTQLPDYYPVRTPSTSNIFISTHRPGEEFRRWNELFFYRYNGDSWIKKEVRGGGFSGFGSTYRGPYLNHSTADVLGYSIGESTVYLLNYDANQEDWTSTVFTTPVNWLDRYVKVSTRSALIGDNLYYLEPNGNWLEIGQIDISRLNDDSWFDDLKSANDLYVVSQPYNSTRFYRVLNGEIEETRLTRNMDKRTAYYDVGDRLLGNGIMAAFSNDHPQKYDARNFYLYKWQEDNFREGHTTIVASKVSVNDGNLNINKWYTYNYTSAKVDPTGHTPLFNEITVVTGGQNPDERPKGYTKHYFHNGKPLTGLPKIPAEQVADDVLLFAGSHYLTEMYNSQDQLVTSSETVYSTFKQNVLNTAGQAIDESYFVRPTRSLTQDFLAAGTQSALTLTSYNAHGYPAQVSNYSSENTSNAEASNEVLYTYYPEGYSTEAVQYNLYSEIISTRTRANGEVVSANATVWTDKDSIPRASKTYGWRGFGSPVFDTWDPVQTLPGNQWRLSNEVLTRDDKGNILESTDFMQERESAIYDDLQLNPVLSASYATEGRVAGTSFEAMQPGKITANTSSTAEAYTGSRSLNGDIARFTPQPHTVDDVYHVYYWYKNDPGTVSIATGTVEDQGDQRTAQGWTLRRWKVSGRGEITITVPATGYIDELRIHPEEAYVTTFVYDDRQRKIAETGPGMATTFYYYDDYHRQHYITDHEGHIVLYYEYGFKKIPE